MLNYQLVVQQYFLGIPCGKISIPFDRNYNINVGHWVYMDTYNYNIIGIVKDE